LVEQSTFTTTASCPASRRLCSTSKSVPLAFPTPRDPALTSCPVHREAAQQASSQGGQGRASGARQAEKGLDPQRPPALYAPADSLYPHKAIQQNHSDIAKIYAQNAIRKQNERLNLLRLASRIDAVSSKVQTAVTMRQVSGSMANVVKGMDMAMKSMDLEKVRRAHLTI